jgi:hypothetical protein
MFNFRKSRKSTSREASFYIFHKTPSQCLPLERALQEKLERALQEKEIEFRSHILVYI